MSAADRERTDNFIADELMKRVDAICAKYARILMGPSLVASVTNNKGA